ncbi:MAG: hypothetical protein AB1650_03380 [Candidatus Omnitrophota bacterium]
MKTFKHSGNLGDIIYSLPAVQALGGGELYLNNDPSKVRVKNAGMSHPMTDEMMRQLRELLIAQPYITDVNTFIEQRIDYDLDQFRRRLPFPQLAIVYLKLFGIDFDLTKPWLFNVKEKPVHEIVIQRSDRFLNKYCRLNWSLLKNYQKKCVFIGFKHEYQKFVKDTGLDIPKYPESTITEFAEIINGSKLFIGNQSLGFALAEGLKKNRILDPYYPFPTAWPLSNNSSFYLTKAVIESALNGETICPTNNYKKRNLFYLLQHLPFFTLEIANKIIEKNRRR